jgi:hypothetical protein
MSRRTTVPHLHEGQSREAGCAPRVWDLADECEVQAVEEPGMCVIVHAQEEN